MELFYAEPESIEGKLAVLDDFERRHIVQTLRKKTGDIIHFTDGYGYHYTGTIRQTSPRLAVEIRQKELMPFPDQQLTLACGFIKQNRLDFILEKGTELGVNHFIFFKSRYANYYSANEQRFQKVIRQALKQSLHFYRPALTILTSFQDFLDFSGNFALKLVAIDQSFPALKHILDKKTFNRKILITVGPEGGFSNQEIDLLLQENFEGISLGSHRLRTETAAISAVAFVKQFIQ